MRTQLQHRILSNCFLSVSDNTSPRRISGSIISLGVEAKRKRYMMTARNPGERRQFAPLDEKLAKGSMAPRLMGVVFDVDGTLCEPQTYMFAEMRAAANVPKTSDILDHVYSLPPTEQETALSKIRHIERTAMSNQVAQPGLLTLITYLETHNIPKGICTRNFLEPVEHLLGKFLSKSKFHPIVTRDFRPPKPHPAGILHIANEFGLEGGEGLIMVGDSIDDMTAGFKAGAATVLLVNDVNRHLVEHEHTDLVVERLDDLVEILDKGFVGKAR